MSKTIVAIYDDITTARQVVEDLVTAHFERDTISLITNDANNQYSRYLDESYTAREDAVTAGEGAGFGAVVGALTGILVGLAALTIPGLGIAIVAGPIVAGLTGAVAGALTGGVVGALVKSGVPEDEAPYYAEGIRRGGTLISLNTSDTLRAQDIMNQHGAVNIHERISIWRQSGWKGFESDVATEPVSEQYDNIPTPPLTTNAFVPVVLKETPLTVIPAVKNEPPIDNEDTTKSRPVLVTPTETIVPFVPISTTTFPLDVPVVVPLKPLSEPEEEVL